MIYPQLVDEYVETGKVKFSFVNVLFHGKESTLGSIAAESVFERSPDYIGTSIKLCLMHSLLKIIMHNG